MQQRILMVLILRFGVAFPFAPPSLFLLHPPTGCSFQADLSTRRKSEKDAGFTSPGNVCSILWGQNNDIQDKPQNQQPNLSSPIIARVCSSLIKLGLRCFITPLGMGRVEGLSVTLTSPSNRALLLRGRIDELCIQCDRIYSSPLLQTSRGIDLQGHDLELGAYPALCLSMPILFFLYLTMARVRTLFRPLIMLTFLCSLTGFRPLWLIRKWQTSLLDHKKYMPKTKKISVLTYRLAFSGDDLSARNTLVRGTLRRAMESLLRNSVVGVALSAASVSASNVPLTIQQQQQSQEQQMADLVKALEANEANTSVKLNKVTVASEGKLLLDASATFPQPARVNDQQQQQEQEPLLATIDFVVRVTVAPLNEIIIPDTPPETTSNPALALSSTFRPGSTPEQAVATANQINNNKRRRRRRRHGILIKDAEVKASFTKETPTGTIVPMEFFGQPIPDLWIPIISGGVAFPFGRRHRVTSVESFSSQSDTRGDDHRRRRRRRSSSSIGGEDRMDVCGEIFFGGNAPDDDDDNDFNRTWNFPFSRTLSGRNGDNPPPPPPRRLLPPRSGSAKQPLVPPKQ